MKQMRNDIDATTEKVTPLFEDGQIKEIPVPQGKDDRELEAMFKDWFDETMKTHQLCAHIPQVSAGNTIFDHSTTGSGNESLVVASGNESLGGNGIVINPDLPSGDAAVNDEIDPQEILNNVDFKPEVKTISRLFRKDKHRVYFRVFPKDDSVSLDAIDSIKYITKGFSGKDRTINDGPEFEHTVLAWRSFEVTLLIEIKGVFYRMNEYVEI